MKKPELLAPAGNLKCLIAAIKAKADAVYLGLKQFNMRETGQNFSFKDLEKAKKICEENKVKLYLTLNTIIYDNEIKKIENIIKKIKKQKLADAIICWDLSIIQLCKKYKIPFHISTQASISNSESARFYKKLGAKRAILARELNIKQIKEISKILPVETFIHGAMCVSISGRCFTSQFLHNRSANRGNCQHPCRKSYKVEDDEGNKLRVKNNKIFSAKDLCTLLFIEKLKKANITSFKIEGRNREPEYVYIVTKAYRQAIDKKLTKKETKEIMKDLENVYNRQFSSGFYIKSPTSDDFASVEHSASKKTKKFIGKIYHYWKKPKVAAVKLNAGKLKIGDEIIVTGKSTFFKTKIKDMEINHKKIKKVEKGQEVGIKLPKAKKGDDVYLVINK